MASLFGASLGLNMSDFDIGGFGINESDVLELDEGASSFSVDSEDGFSQLYTGAGFDDTDADDIPDAGVIHNWYMAFESDLLFHLTDFSMSWPDYWGFVTLGDTDGFLNAVFGGDDLIVGSSTADNLFALGGNDTINGLAGKDRLDGGKGKDGLSGGEGKDKLTGGAAQDTLSGGASADTFLFTKAKDTAVGAAKHDIIADLSSAQNDRIDLRKIDADSTVGGNQAFHDGGTVFDSEAGELIAFDDGFGNTLVQGDINGDAIADFEILCTGFTELIGDLVLY